MIDTDTITPQVIAAAQEAYDSFEQRTRDSGGAFYTLKEGERAQIGERNWIGDIIQAAHGDFMPDDWRYEFIVNALAHISDAEEDTDSMALRDEATEPDIYTAERLRWLASNLNRPSYCDEAQAEFGLASSPESDMDIVERIGWGQSMEKGEVFDSVLRSLAEHVEEEQS